MTLPHGSSNSAESDGVSRHREGAGPAPGGGAQGADRRTQQRELIDSVDRLSPRNSFRIGLIVGAVVTLAAGLLIIQNGSSIRLHWAWFGFRAPLWIVLGLTLVAGIVLGLIAPALARRSRRRARERRSALAQARETLADSGARKGRSRDHDATG